MPAYILREGNTNNFKIGVTTKTVDEVAVVGVLSLGGEADEAGRAGLEDGKEGVWLG